MDRSTADSTSQSSWANLGIEFYLIDAQGVSYRLRPPHTYSFGRDEQVNFQIQDGLVSRRHCELRWNPQANFDVVDLGSRNGTWMNGERLSELLTLHDNDALRVGTQKFIFRTLPRGADIASLVQHSVADAQVTIEQSPEDKPSGASFRGMLGHGGLMPLLEFFQMTGRTGLLDLDGGGQVWFSVGIPVDARSADLEGLAALQALVEAPGGPGFAVTEGATPPKGPRIEGDAKSILMSLARETGAEAMDASDMRLAQNLQARLLQRIPNLAGYEFGVHYASASSVGGDFYDIGPIGDGRILIVLGDVSGHGVQAAMVVAMAVKTLRLVRAKARDPVEVLTLLNDEVRDDLLPGQFLTCFAAMLDPFSGGVTVVLAGHHPGWLCQGGTITEVGKPGMAIGFVGSELLRRSLRPVEVRLAPGDLLVQCTDGLIEAQLSGGEEFGDERLKAMLAERGTSHTAPQAILDMVAKRFYELAGTKLADDLTLLALGRQPA